MSQHLRLSVLGAATVLAVSACASLFMPDFFKTVEEQKKEFLTKHPNPHVYYEVDGKSFHYVHTGNVAGPRVVLIHGSPGEWGGWSGMLLDTTITSRAEIVAVDRPGFGESTPGEPERVLATQARELLPALLPPPGRNILVGHSFGGPTVVELALQYPERVRGLVIVAGSVSPELEARKWYQYPARWFLFRWMVPSAISVCNEEIFWLKGELEKQAPRLADIRIPTIVIQGGEDDLVPPGNAQYVKEKFVHAPVKLVEKADMNHFVPWLNYPLIQAAVIEQLDQIRAEKSRP